MEITFKPTHQCCFCKTKFYPKNGHLAWLHQIWYHQYQVCCYRKLTIDTLFINYGVIDYAN